VIEISGDIDSVVPRFGIRDHEFHIDRLLASIGCADTRRTEFRTGSRADGIDALNRTLPFALLSPGLTRRFPFSAPLRTRGRVSFRVGGGQMGRLPNDYQSQRALGVDPGNGTFCLFRRAIASGGRGG
jgi:hypothetical protein